MTIKEKRVYRMTFNLGLFSEEGTLPTIPEIRENDFERWHLLLTQRLIQA